MNKALVKDLAKKRREYLRKKSVANVAATISGMVALISGVLLILITVVISMDANLRKEGYTLAAALLMAYFLGTITFFCGRLFRSSLLKSKSMTYIPPVVEQIAALPAEEILVRGSDQPTATPEELLRAAHARQVDPAVELLRPNG